MIVGFGKPSIRILVLAALSFTLVGLAIANAQQTSAAPSHLLAVAPDVAAKNCIKIVSPIYPGMARTARIAGEVLLQVTISKSGDVVSAESISGHPMLVYAAIATVKEWKYKPYLVGGRPVEISTQVTMKFDPSLPDGVVTYPNGAPPMASRPSTLPSGLDTGLGVNKAFDQAGRLKYDAGLDRKDWTIDRAGNVYIVDSGSHRISRISAATGERSAIVGELREPSGTVRIAEHASGLIAVDGNGDVYVNTVFGTVFRISAKTGEATLLGGVVMTKDGDRRPAFALYGLNVDADGNLYIALQNSIRRKSATTGVTTEIINTDTGVSEFAVDPAGNVYIKLYSYGNFVGIKKISIETGNETTLAGQFDGGLAVDAAGNIYFASKDNFWKMDGKTGQRSRVAPKPMAYQGGKFRVDGAGNLYVACAGYIQRFPSSQATNPL